MAIVVLVFLGLVVITGWGFGSLPTGFLPVEDQGYCFANIQLPDAASLPRTERVMKKFDEIMDNTPGVADWVSIAGYSMLSGTAGSNVGMMVVIFEPWGDRTATELKQEEILKNLRQRVCQSYRICGDRLHTTSHRWLGCGRGIPDASAGPR